MTVIAFPSPRLMRLPLLLIGFTVLTLGVVFFALSVGPSGATVLHGLGAIFAALGLANPWPAAGAEVEILANIRLPRVVLAGLVGAVLATAGASLQGMFRNPLVDPGLIGVASGASLGAVFAILLVTSSASLAWLGPLAIPVMAMGGGLGAVVIVMALSKVRGQLVVWMMLLCGIAVTAISAAGVGLAIFYADEEQLRTITFWTLGSLASGTWTNLAWISLPLVAILIATPFFANNLNALMLGEAQARTLGVRVERTKWTLVAFAACGVGLAVSVTGVIGFIGLVGPHLARLAFGADHRRLLPLSAFMGANLLILSDALARLVVQPTELPVGIVSALIGGPFFVWLLWKERSRIGGTL